MDRPDTRDFEDGDVIVMYSTGIEKWSTITHLSLILALGKLLRLVSSLKNQYSSHPGGETLA
jgi:hypothetical protein